MQYNNIGSLVMTISFLTTVSKLFLVLLVSFIFG